MFSDVLWEGEADAAWAPRRRTAATSACGCTSRPPAVSRRSPPARSLTGCGSANVALRMYDPLPTYPVTGGHIGKGYDQLVDAAAAATMIAVDGPPWVAWDEIETGLTRAWARRGRRVA